VQPRERAKHCCFRNGLVSLWEITTLWLGRASERGELGEKDVQYQTLSVLVSVLVSLSLGGELSVRDIHPKEQRRHSLPQEQRDQFRLDLALAHTAKARHRAAHSRHCYQDSLIEAGETKQKRSSRELAQDPDGLSSSGGDEGLQHHAPVPPLLGPKHHEWLMRDPMPVLMLLLLLLLLLLLMLVLILGSCS
jgi:hypothetical protein